MLVGGEGGRMVPWVVGAVVGSLCLRGCLVSGRVVGMVLGLGVVVEVAEEPRVKVARIL